jgi:hypothetical protein
MTLRLETRHSATVTVPATVTVTFVPPSIPEDKLGSVELKADDAADAQEAVRAIREFARSIIEATQA